MKQTKVNLRGVKAISKCNKRREYSGVQVRDITIEGFKRTRVTREAVELYKDSSITTVSDVDKFIDEKFDDLSFPNEVVKELNKQETVTLVHKYLEADDRRSILNSKIRRFSFRFCGETVYYKPDFLYEYKEETRHGIVPVVEVVSMTTSTQKYMTSTRYGAGKETVSLHHNLEGLGMLLFGKAVLGKRAGIVRCVSDSLKTAQDKGGDYSAPWKTAEKDDSGTKSACNRVWTEVFFDKKGHIVNSGYYPLGDERGYKNTRWDNRKLFPSYAETFSHFLEGKETCSSKEECRKNCEYYELCNYNHIPVSKDEKKETRTRAVEPSLNLEQQEVADFREGICCVDAGPGSGKTQVMAFRIAKMIAEGTKPEDFLAISFSKAAVKTITDRVKFFVHDVYGMYHIDTDKIKVATFNSLGDALLNKYHEELGYTEEPELADEVDVFNLTKEAIDFDKQVEGFDYKNYKMPRRSRDIRGGVVAEISEVIANIRSNGITKDEWLKTKDYTPEQAEYIWETNEKFSALMVEKNMKDYSDQQYQVLRLLDEINPEAIAETYRFAHIVVDEFQDSNDFQMLFISELLNTAKFKSLMVVGDDAQAIYLFRGTSPENIINFEKKLGTGLPVKEVVLTRNYRSTGELVDLGNEVLEHNTNRIKKVLTSHRGYSGEKPVFKSFEKSKDEINFICDKIQTLILSGVKPKDIAVICATRSSLKAVSKVLSERGVLSQFDMGERLLDNSRVRSAIGFCNFATDPSATRGLLEYMNEMYNGKLFDIFSSERISDLVTKGQEDFTNFYLPLTLEEKKDCVLNALSALDDGTDAIYTAFLEKIKAKTRLNILSLLSYIRDFYELDINSTAEKSGEINTVSLVTAHSSKGKEWNHVFVSLSDFDKVPTRNLEEKEEKRRLIFVAYTRARDTLTVTTLREKEREGDYAPVNPWYAEMKTYKSFNNLD